MESSGPKATAALTLLFLATVLIPHTPLSSAAPPNNQPTTLYFHRQSNKTINGFSSTLWSNTTQQWSTTTQIDGRSAVKGTPAVWDFYSQPVMAGNTTFTGPLTFTLFLASTANTGTGTVISGTVSKVTSTGTVIPLAVASISNQVIGTTISVYTLTIISNTYQIEAGSNFDLTVTVNIASKTLQTVTLYYDVPSYKSQVTFTFQNRLGTSNLSTYDRTGTPSRFFSRNSTLSSRQITIRTQVYDAIGLYDISQVNTTITSPSNTVYLSNTPLTLIQGGPLNYTGTWSLNITYAVADPSGNYQTNLEVTDNTGVSDPLQLSYVLYATWKVGLATISSDTPPVPVQGVVVTVYSQGNPVFSGVSDSTGTVVPGSVLLPDNSTYIVTSYWEGALVNQTGTISLNGPTLLTLKLSAYTVNFGRAFRDSKGNLLPQPPSSFLLTSQVNGSITSPNPTGTYLLTAGNYGVSSVIWKGVDVTPSAGVSFNPRAGTPSIDLQIYNLTILAVDQNGQALPNAQVTLTRNGQTIAQGTTGNDGSLNLGSLPGGQYIVQVKAQSQTTSTTISLTQDTSQSVQIKPPTTGPAPSGSWIAQTWQWFALVGAAVGGVLGYRQISRSRLTFKEEPFDYINTITGGGFRDGDTILIEGDEAAGKTTLCEELAHKSLTKGDPVAFLTYETVEGVRESMKRLRWEPVEYESRNRLQLVPCEATQGTEYGFGMVENFYGITALNINLNTALEQARPPGKPVMIIDSLTSLAETANASGLANLIVETSEKIKRLQGRFFLTIGRNVPKHALTRLEDASDGILQLVQVIENNKPAFDLRVKKMRGRRYMTTPVRFRMDPGKGMVFETKRSLAIKNKTPEEDTVGERRLGRGQPPSRREL